MPEEAYDKPLESYKELDSYGDVDSLYEAMSEVSDGSLCRLVRWSSYDGHDQKSLRIKEGNFNDREMEINFDIDNRYGIIEHGGCGATYFDMDEATYFFGWSSHLEHYQIAIIDGKMFWRFTLPISKMKDPKN